MTKQGATTLTLSGNNTYTGATTVEQGKLVVSGSINSATTVQSGATIDINGTVGGALTVNSGGTVSGSGTITGLATLNSGATINPGNSPGTQSYTGGFVWSAGADYNWQIYNAAGTAGSSNGWDLIAVSGGAWDITGLSSGNKFDINLWSLSGISPDANGSAINFSSATPYTWEILTYTSLAGTFTTDLFNINVAANNGTSGFANDLGGGVFSLAVDGDSLNLLFTPGGGPGPSPVPEPGTWAAAALLAGAAGYVRWRRRKEQPKDA
jgi:MYXO-CTERM domain-containing protein